MKYDELEAIFQKKAEEMEGFREMIEGALQVFSHDYMLHINHGENLSWQVIRVEHSEKKAECLLTLTFVHKGLDVAAEYSAQIHIGVAEDRIAAGLANGKRAVQIKEDRVYNGDEVFQELDAYFLEKVSSSLN